MAGTWECDGAQLNQRTAHYDFENLDALKPTNSRNDARSTVAAVDPHLSPSEKKEVANANEEKTDIIRKTPERPLFCVGRNLHFNYDNSKGIFIGKATLLLKALSIGISSPAASLFVNATEAVPTFDFIVDALTKTGERDSQRQQRPAAAGHQGGGWKPCHQLKHYKQTTPRPARGATSTSDFQILNFNDRPFNVGHLPADIPADSKISNMKLEANRLKSFSLDGRPTFLERCKTGQTPGELAACGFFYMQEADKVKCAFCLGVLFNWDQGESVEQGHRLRYSTCPLLLGLDVGNVPIEKPLDQDKLSQQCSEDCKPEAPAVSGFGHSWDWEAGAAQLACRPRPPVSSATASAACRPGVTDNLEMLSRAARSPEAAAAYYPMRHPGHRSCQDREASLARSSQHSAVPAALLASAGFFLDAEATSCYWCGLRVLHWQEADDPWVEHARWSPRCCHMLLARGSEFVLMSRASHPPYPVEQRQKPGASGETQGDAAAAADIEPQTFASGGGSSNPLIDYRIEPRYFKAREDCPATLALQQRLGCDPDDVRTALFLQLKCTGDDFRSGEQFLQSALAQQAKRQLRGSSAREFYEQTQRDQELLLAREPKPFEDEELDWRACKVCMDKVINVTLLDCKHLCCCSTCAKHLDTCPLCRAPIRATMIVNMD